MQFDFYCVRSFVVNQYFYGVNTAQLYWIEFFYILFVWLFIIIIAMIAHVHPPIVIVPSELTFITNAKLSHCIFFQNKKKHVFDLHALIWGHAKSDTYQRRLIDRGYWKDKVCRSRKPGNHLIVPLWMVVNTFDAIKWQKMHTMFSQSLKKMEDIYIYINKV